MTAGAALGWVAVFALPDRYEAGAQVLVDTRTALKPALQGLATDQDVSVQISYVRQSLLAGPQLRKIALEVGALPATGIDPGHQEQLLSNLKSRIQLTVQSADDRPDRPDAGTTYGITYQDTNRERALRLVSILLTTMVSETLGNKQEGSENAQQFLEAQIKDYEARLRAAEDRLAQFKSSHLDQMPAEQGGYFQLLQKQTETIGEIRTKLITAQNRRDTLEKELHGDAAISAASGSTVVGTKGVQAGADTVSRIAEIQAHLDELLLKYTEKHPDVIAARGELADLEMRRAAEIEKLRRGDPNAAATSGASSSPVYQSIQLALNQVDVDISDLRTELAQHEQKAQDLHELLNTAPQIEAEYAQLNRDYDVNKAQYTALLSNYEKARLGERADKAGSVRFEVVQPPTVGFQPVSPARTKLLTGILIAAIAAGAGLAYGLDRLRPVVGSAEGVTKLTGLTVLSVVGPAFPTHTRRAARRHLRRVSLAFAVVLVAFVLVVSLSRKGVRLSIPGATHQAQM